MKLKIIGGKVVDPAQKLEAARDLLIEDGVIKALAEAGSLANVDAEEISARGLLVLPGLIDMHTHLREPGFEYKEDIESGALAAAAGGFTTICCMANTEPVNDNAAVTGFILRRAETAAPIRVLPIAAVSRGQLGKQLAEIGELKAAGAVALSDDGKPVANSDFLRRAMEYTAAFGLLIIEHCEDLALKGDGVMNEGAVSTRLGLAGIPSAAEEIPVARDIILSRYLNLPLHLAHISTKGSVELIRNARAAGVPVSAETAPHYFSLTDEALAGYPANAKVNPPLRSGIDREAVIQGLKDGSLPVIASDHAPHDQNSKLVEFNNASWGISGIETSFALSYQLVREGHLSLLQLVEKMAWNPARILNLNRGTLEVGRSADITLADPELTLTVNPERFVSKGKNSPFGGRRLTGWPVTTIFGGKVVYKRKSD